MSRIEKLERDLFEAARDQERRQASGGRTSLRRRTLTLLACVAVAGTASAAVAAVNALHTGRSVPPDPAHPGSMQPDKPTVGAGHIVAISPARAEATDPAGGLRWGVGTYRVKPRTSAHTGHMPADIAAQFNPGLICVVVGRTNSKQLGVLGQDGAFNNDGAFHPLTPTSATSSECTSRPIGRPLVILGSRQRVPASGYSGSPGGAIGGCRERVALSGAAVSPQTRRRLKNVAACPASALRTVIAGLAGPEASTATASARGYRKTIRLSEDGSYIFVLPHGSNDATVVIAGDHGLTCQPLAAPAGCSWLYPARRALHPIYPPGMGQPHSR